jgi:hypothetical protein
MIAPYQVAAVINIRHDRIHIFLSRMRAPHRGSERYNFLRRGVGTVEEP